MKVNRLTNHSIDRIHQTVYRVGISEEGIGKSLSESGAALDVEQWKNSFMVCWKAFKVFIRII